MYNYLGFEYGVDFYHPQSHRWGSASGNYRDQNRSVSVMEELGQAGYIVAKARS